MNQKLTLCFGEIMLRLKSPDQQRLFQSPSLEATFGGGEANVAVSLSILGHQTRFISAVPDNAVGESALAELRRYGVDTSAVLRAKNGRLGIYFLETGANQRPSTVIYDREASCIATVKAEDFNWPQLFANADWFHITGITPALSQTAADEALAAAKQARLQGIEVSLDLNFRRKLWNYGKKAPEIMRELCKYATVLIANEEDIQHCLNYQIEGADVDGAELDATAYLDLAKRVKAEYPNLKSVAITLRRSYSADHNGWGAVLLGPKTSAVSRQWEINNIIDRVGGGDSFAAGLIHALKTKGDNCQAIIDFAVAASCLKHSISGDFNLSTLAEIEALAAGNASGRVQR